MTGSRILIVEDEKDIRQLLGMAFELHGWVVQKAGDLGSAMEVLESFQPDLCVTDMRLPDGSGIDLVRHLARSRPGLPVIVVTAYGSIETAVEALKAGAYDFISKPIDVDALRTIARNALGRGRGEGSPEILLLGESSDAKALRDAVSTAAGSHAPVMIRGEAGTGRRRVAREIHRLSAMIQQPFIAVDCEALPSDSLVEVFFGGHSGRDLVGHEEGVLRAALGGTLYLGNVSALSPLMQTKLLQVMQDRIVPDGPSSPAIMLDVRFVSSAGDPDEVAVDGGGLIHDLYYRLNVLEVTVPPLRQRMEDIPALASALCEDVGRSTGSDSPGLSNDALNKLMQHEFPGNFSELQNVVERASVLAGGTSVLAEDIRFPGVMPMAGVDLTGGVIGGNAERGSESLPRRLEANERAAILAALEETRWNRTAAARKLGLSFRQLRYRIKKFGLDTPKK